YNGRSHRNETNGQCARRTSIRRIACRCQQFELAEPRCLGPGWRWIVTSAASKQIVEYLVQSRNAVQAAIEDPDLIRTIEQIVDCFYRALTAGCKILLAGNGGSAGDAQHLAGEFLSRLNYDRAPVAAIALTTDSSVLTAIGNDYGYERVFERQ